MAGPDARISRNGRGYKRSLPLSLSQSAAGRGRRYFPSDEHIRDNIQLVCQWVNRAKNNMANEEFKAVLLECLGSMEKVTVLKPGASNEEMIALLKSGKPYTLGNLDE